MLRIALARNLLAPSVLGVVLLTSVGCTAVIALRDAYPAHYSAPPMTGHAPHPARIVKMPGVTIYEDYQDLPKGIFDALPPRFKVAALTDHLLVLRDDDGWLRYTPKWANTLVKAKHSQAFNRKADDLRKKGMVEYRFPGYLDMAAFIDNLDYDEVIDTEHNQAWRNWIDEFTENSATLKALSEDNQELSTDIADAVKELSNLDETSKTLDQQIKRTKASADRWEREARRLGARGLGPLEKESEASPYDYRTLDTPYEFSSDPLRTVYESGQNFRRNDAGWSASGVSNPNLHTYTHDAYTSFIDRMRNPASYYSADTAARIDALSDLTLVSAARSPIHQATLTDNPNAAGWMDSDHALGLSVDIGLTGTNYDVSGTHSAETRANYDLLVNVARDAGLVRTHAFSVDNERNHFTVSQTATRENGEVRLDIDHQIALARNAVQAEVFQALATAANAAGENLATEIGEATGQNAELMAQAAQLSSAISAKQEQVAEQRRELDRQRERERRWRKIYERFIEQQRSTCGLAIYSDADIDAMTNRVEYQMSPLHNSVKHWDCHEHREIGPC